MADVVVNGRKFKLKQCEVTRFEDEFGHSYEIDGEPVVGVTTMLSMGMPIETGLLEYFKRTDKETQEEILSDAQDRGSNVHQAIESLLLGEKVLSRTFTRIREKKGISAFVDWFDKVQPTDVVSEHVVAYIKGDVKFAGTLDLVCTVIINDKRILIDFKTGRTSSKKDLLQVQAYKAAYEQSTGEKIDECYVLYLGTNHKGAKPKIDDNGIPNCGLGWAILKSPYEFKDFMRAYDMAIFMNDGKYPKPPKVLEFPEQWQILS